MRRSREELAAVKPKVLDALLQGNGVRKVARDFHLSPSTVNIWWQAAKAVVSIREKRDELGERVAKYLETTLDTLRAQSGYFAERPFLDDPKKTSNAAQLAILHGVLADKAVRILGALRRPPDSEPPAVQ